MGTLGGVVGMLTLGYLGSSDPNLGGGYELLAIAAAVIGGTPLRGGKVTIVGAALGALLLSVVSAVPGWLSRPLPLSRDAGDRVGSSPQRAAATSAPGPLPALCPGPGG